MRLTPEQAHVLNTIKSVARHRGVPYKHVKAAVETALVESNLTNPHYGDADSQGWRQERSSLYKNPTNLKASINRFFDEAAAADRGQGPGRLAADVQRPAEQYRGRYRQRAAEAAALLRGETYKDSAPAVVPATPRHSAVDPTAKRDLLLGYLAERDKPDALLDLAVGLKSLPKVEAPPTAYGSKDQPTTVKGGKLFELFYDPVGYRSPGNDHYDHVHVAAPPSLLPEVRQLAKRMGLVVSSGTRTPAQNRAAGGSPGSYHLKGEADDFAGDPKRMAAFAKRVARLYR